MVETQQSLQIKVVRVLHIVINSKLRSINRADLTCESQSIIYKSDRWSKTTVRSAEKFDSSDLICMSQDSLHGARSIDRNKIFRTVIVVK